VGSELDERIRANLNLYAVLQNLEDLVQLDSEMAAKTKNWDVTIQFSVNGGPRAYLAFKNGVCTHGRGRHENPSVKLFFTSPKHLNAMLDGKARPIPLKGFTKLGFLSKEFMPLAGRLAYYLKPEGGLLEDENFLKINTILTLHTALFAVGELAALEPVSKHLAAHMGDGILQVEVPPEGPYVALHLDHGAVSVTKGKADNPKARMIFKNLKVANDLLNDRVDSFRAVAQGDIALKGHVPMLDNFDLILDRVRAYLS